MYIHVYKLKDSELGFYHTGIEIFGREFTYCCDKGIVRHKPRRCEWGHFLGTICLGDVCMTLQQLEQLLEEMSREGFSSADYDVMENSCNVFSEVRYNSFYCDITSWRIRLLPLNLVSPTTSPPLFTIKPRWGQCLLRLSGQKLFDLLRIGKLLEMSMSGPWRNAHSKESFYNLRWLILTLVCKLKIIL